MTGSTTSLPERFNGITQPDEPLGPRTWLKVGGPAQYLVRPTSQDELVDIVRFCREDDVPIRVLGGGSNLLIRDDGVSGVVLQLDHPSFAELQIDGETARCGSGLTLSHLISETVKAGLAGLETLTGIPGTVGGALRGNAGGRNGDIGQFVQSVTVLTTDGTVSTRKEDELSFAYRQSSINELVILEATFALTQDDPDEITQRMRKLWIMKKSSQPLSFQSAGCIFKNPRGLSAGTLMEQAGLKGTRVGGAEISDRHANFIVTHEDASSDDVLRLIDLARSKVTEQFGVELELEIQVW
ncbi:UDP-N-acetylmuramate dehydrogenase [Thalassoroseus pseudoceratinae]|uniref:UDP-N-acetylmuramate dehydrogenase n=1 Tax=Thalassoroseus pseudoceratinae TaxID=2713176 RepID=UPI00197D8F1F|nr:UDP-N-acetylmuramate dehydrogenase [Thalassoroseus pseudoceratinae]